MDGKSFARLSIDINKDLTPDDVRLLKELMTDEYGDGELQAMKGFFDIWNKLKANGKISPSNLHYLRERFCDLELSAPVKKIDKAVGGQKARAPVQVEAKTANPVQVVEDEEPNGVMEFPDLAYEVMATMNNRGVMLIINQFTKQRQGTLEDVSALKELFQNKLGFHVDSREDQTKAKVFAALKDKVRMMRDNEVDRFFCVILSHGDQEGIWCVAKDGRTKEQQISLENEILPMFRADKLPKMKGRPKIFIIQACRGYDFHKSVVADDKAKATSSSRRTSTAAVSMNSRYMPNEADFLIAYPQTDGFKSFRVEEEGSWFIQSLVRIFKVRYTEDELLALLTKVSYEVSLKNAHVEEEVDPVVQMPCFMSTLRKRLYLT